MLKFLKTVLLYNLNINYNKGLKNNYNNRLID